MLEASLVAMSSYSLDQMGPIPDAQTKFWGVELAHSKIHEEEVDQELDGFPAVVAVHITNVVSYIYPYSRDLGYFSVNTLYIQ